MMALFVVGGRGRVRAESHGSPAMQAAGIHGPNLEGKEQRFGIASSSLFAAVTTAASCGAVNAAMESLTGLGGVVPMAQMMTGENISGGVGSGLYGMLVFVILGVFISGLMVGRTPEFLGKKIEAREIKLTVLASVGVPLLVLATAGVAIAPRPAGPRSRVPGRRGSPRPSTPTSRRPTTTARRSPATAPPGSPISSAAWRCSAGASSPCSRCWPSPARSPASA